MHRIFNSIPAIVLGVLLGCGSPHASAAAITSWTRGLGTNSSNLGTSNPTFGNGAATSADQQSIYATISTYSLLNAGDSVAFSGNVNFTLSGSGNANLFRIGLYDVNGQSNTNGWLGYLYGNSAGTTAGVLGERNNPNSGGYYSFVTGSTSVSSATATGNTSLTTGDCAFSFTITRNVSSGLDIAWSLVGAGYNLSGTYTDATPQTYTFNRVALTTVTGLNASEIQFSNLAVIPEPSTVFLMALGLGVILFRRKRTREFQALNL